MTMTKNNHKNELQVKQFGAKLFLKVGREVASFEPMQVPIPSSAAANTAGPAGPKDDAVGSVGSRGATEHDSANVFITFSLLHVSAQPTYSIHWHIYIYPLKETYLQCLDT